jgi:protein TonB
MAVTASIPDPLNFGMPERSPGDSPNARFLSDHPADDRLKSSWWEGAGVSAVAHISVLVLAVWVGTRPGVQQAISNAAPILLDIVWLQQPGPGGGGGGGGDKSPEPARKVEAPGKDKITVPVAKPTKLENPMQPKDEPPKVEQKLDIPAQPMASGVVQLPGVLEGPPSASAIGPGSGPGIGPGTGAGLGPGSGGGTGGGVFQPGNGVSNPQPIYSPRPNYTADAMRAKVSGTVSLEAVVLPDGNVGEVRITRSLDPTFGLDQEAVRTVRSWKFRPGMKQGRPVAVWVIVELEFTLR